MQNTSEFAKGQRWLSETEPELGLGMVVDFDFRTVAIAYNSCGESRRYSRQTAPLNRIIFSEGDSIKSRSGQPFTVSDVEMRKNLAFYKVFADDKPELSAILPETELSDMLLLNRPVDRLMTGQIDSYQWFAMKQQTLEQLGIIEQSNVLGLCSGRTELIPHQLYIAAEVARRYAPRVMLADEVGLGKTIEAGLILQQQLASGLATRVLIIVPEALLHQWLVEMLRRFNLRFSLLDAERCEAIAEEHQDNPFLEDQLILTSMGLLSSNPKIFAQACEGEWDLCIVDEAHHLQDKPEAVSAEQTSRQTSEQASAQTSQQKESQQQPAETDYTRMQKLAESTNGMLLLTATPEQLGDESHFALLRLLDPHRFNSYEEFRAEQAHYRTLAGTINELLEHPKRISASEKKERQAKVQQLLDEHGTGRILFRNTRRSLTGFPTRKLNAWPLEKTSGELTQRKVLHTNLARPDNAQDKELHTESDAKNLISDTDLRVEAEPGEANWPATEARVQWLIEFLQKNRKDKVLLICAEDSTAVELDRYLRVQAGIRSSVFHRHMNIVERDRAAAYFAGSEASPEASARILVCSEIGSEGRNFQFCRHLVLFDLPLNPDLLEQRIGRLDRIGQKNTIQIHVPYLLDTEQEVLFRWYQEALDAFVTVAPAAWRVYREHEARLKQFLAAARFGSAGMNDQLKQEFEAFLKQAAARTETLQQEMEKGRDRLLEINSFHEDEANAVIKAITEFEAKASPQKLLCTIFDSYGIDYEQNSDDTWTLYPGEEMLLPSFPEMPDEGIDASFHRQTALHREDVQFLHWQHPLVRGAMDLVLDTHLGRAAVSAINSAHTHPALAPWPLVVETLYRIVIPAPRHLQLQRYFPATSKQFMVALSFDSIQDSPKQIRVPGDEMQQSLSYIDKHEAFRLVKQYQAELQTLMQHSEHLAKLAMGESVNMAAKTMLETQTAEIRRLVSLKQRNPNVRDSELEYLRNQTLQLHESFKQASVELVAVHVMFGQRAD